MPQALPIPDAKEAVEKEWEKLEKIQAWQLTKVRNKKEVIAEARNKVKTVPFCVVNGSLSSQEFGVGTSIAKLQRSSRTPRWHCERWRSIRSIYWTRIGCDAGGTCPVSATLWLALLLEPMLLGSLATNGSDYYGKGNLRKSYWSTVGRRFPIGNAYLYTVTKGYCYLSVWMT